MKYTTSYLFTKISVFTPVLVKGKWVPVLNKTLSCLLHVVFTYDFHKYLIAAYRATGLKSIKDQLPSFTPAGDFRDKRLKTSTPATQTNLIQVDVDGKCNSHITDWPAYASYLFWRYPFIAVCSLSCSGKGLYLLILTTGYEHYERHFLAAADLFKSAEKLSIDTAVSSANEIRYLALPCEVLIRERPEVFTQMAERPKRKRISGQQTTREDYAYVREIALDVCKRGIDITQREDDWKGVLMVCALFGEDGRELAHPFSSNYPTYSLDETDKEFERFLHTPMPDSPRGVGYLVNLVKQYQPMKVTLTTPKPGYLW